MSATGRPRSPTTSPSSSRSRSRACCAARSRAASSTRRSRTSRSTSRAEAGVRGASDQPPRLAEGRPGRIVLFTGKGGGGTTTVAAATATLAAQRGHRTLLVSFNTVGGLAGTLDHPVTGVPLELEPGLFGQQVDLRDAFERRWDAVRPLLDAAWTHAEIEPIEAEELAALTGVGETLALLELRDQLASGRFDLVVVDAGPAADALRLLSFPETLSWYCRRLLPPDGRFVRWVRPSLARSARLAA